MKRKALPAIVEVELVRRAQAGDLQARDTLFEQFAPLMWRFALRSKTKQVEADELFQHCYLAFERSLSKFDLNRKVRFITYLYMALAKASCRSRWMSSVIRFPTHQKVRPGVFSLDTAAEDDSPLVERLECRSAASERHEIERSDEWKRVNRAVNQLPARVKHVIKLRLMLFKLHEIGEMMGFSKERARQLEKRGVDLLRKMLSTPST